MNTAAIAAYLVHREHAAVPAAVRAARELAVIHADRYFFTAWWLEPLAACVAASPAIADPPEAVLDRLAARFAIRLNDANRPRCPRCRTPLRWRDMQVPQPTGRCRLCARPPGHHPIPTPIRTPRTAADRLELFDLEQFDDAPEVA